MIFKLIVVIFLNFGLDFLFQSYEEFCFVFVWGIMGKCELFLFMLKIILLRHKVGLCLHGHIYAHDLFQALELLQYSALYLLEDCYLHKCTCKCT